MHNNCKITFKTIEHIPKEFQKYLIRDYILASSCTRIVDRFEIKIWEVDQLTSKEEYKTFTIPYKDIKEIK